MESKKEEFLNLLKNYQGILYKVSMIYFRSKVDQEDNVQEIIYQLWKSYSTLRTNSFGSWIYAVAINTSISRLRKVSQVEYREDLPDYPDSGFFEESFSKSETFQMLIKAIFKLDEINKSVMLLYLDEKSYEEIAEIMGISKSNVGARILRAKELLKENLNIQNYGK